MTNKARAVKKVLESNNIPPLVIWCVMDILEPRKKPHGQDIKKKKKRPKPRIAILKRQAEELWKEICKRRDGYRCQDCGGTEVLQVHHLISRSNHRMKFEPDNGVTLCRGCHCKVTFQYKGYIYPEKMIELVGPCRWERLVTMSKQPVRPMTVIELEKIIKELL
jgi:hypothetical protein